MREFFAVTLPGLRNPIVGAVTLTVLGAIRDFDIVYHPSGGPGSATEVPSRLMFHSAFDENPRRRRSSDRRRTRAVVSSLIALGHRTALEARRHDGTPGEVHELRGADRVRGARALPDALDRRHRLPPQRATTSPASRPTALQRPEVRRRLEPGRLRPTKVGQPHGRNVRDRVSTVLAIFTGFAFGTLRFPGSGLLFT